MSKKFFKELEFISNNLINNVGGDEVFLDAITSTICEKNRKITQLCDILTLRVGSEVKFINVDGSDCNNIFKLIVNNVETSILFDEKSLCYNNLNYLMVVISKLTPVKSYCQINTWSYINEKNECKNFTEQKQYNQTIMYEMKFLKGENVIISNIKLKPFFETIDGFEQGSDGIFVIRTYDGVLIKIVFNSSNNEENTIYYYSVEAFNEFLGREMLFYQEDFETNGRVSDFMLGFMKNHNFGCIEIINLDDGLFFIKNKKVRKENGKQILITLKPSSDMEYIKAMALLSEKFSDVVNVDILNPKQKYSYHSELLNDVKKQIEND